MSETAEQGRNRRLAVHFLELAIPRLEQIFRWRMLVYRERAVPGGVRFGHLPMETWAVRERCIQWVLSRLHALRQRLARGPVPDLWHGEITATGRHDRAHLTGINVVVQDPLNHPDEVEPLLPFGPVNGVILELWRDSQGNLFYNYHGRRQYVDEDRLR